MPLSLVCSICKQGGNASSLSWFGGLNRSRDSSGNGSCCRAQKLAVPGVHGIIYVVQPCSLSIPTAGTDLWSRDPEDRPGARTSVSVAITRGQSSSALPSLLWVSAPAGSRLSYPHIWEVAPAPEGI